MTSVGPYNYSYIFKYIIIGDMGVGKSCLLHQFTEKKCKYFLCVAAAESQSICPLQSWQIVLTPLEWNLEHALSKCLGRK